MRLKIPTSARTIPLSSRYSPERLDAACQRALSVDLIDVRRFERILVRGPRAGGHAAGASTDAPRSIRQAGRRLRSCQRPHRSFSTRRTLMTTMTELTPLLKRLKLGAVLSTPAIIVDADHSVADCGKPSRVEMGNVG